ncbi:MAG: spore coat protein U domain-containing protein [Beijerinckiaceae bacterium]
MPACRKIVLYLTFLATFFCASSASAQVSCSVNFTTLAFGTVDVLAGAQSDTAGTLSASCSGITGTTRVILCFPLDNGTYPLSGGSRQMGSGANRMLFQVYRDAARTTLWDTSASGMVSILLRRVVPSGTATVYGRVFGGQQLVAPGSYSTTLNSAVRGALYTGTTPPSCSTLPTIGTIPMSVTATVDPACNVTVTNMNFGTTSFFTSNIDATSTVTVTCTNGTPYHVRLDGGLSGATDPTQRKMSLGGNQITYGLYRDASRSLGWGSTDSVNTLDATGSASGTGHTVYGRVPPQPSVPPGIYTDTVIAVVSF